MISQSAALLCALLTTFSAGARDVASFSHQQVSSGQKFEIRTTEAVFRGQIVDRSTGECRLASSADGTTFGPVRRVYLLGATAGPNSRQMLVLMRQVKVGLKMELGLEDLDARHRVVTSEVTGIRLLD